MELLAFEVSMVCLMELLAFEVSMVCLKQLSSSLRFCCDDLVALQWATKVLHPRILAICACSQVAPSCQHPAGQHFCQLFCSFWLHPFLGRSARLLNLALETDESS
jgi:hypothetical protein